MPPNFTDFTLDSVPNQLAAFTTRIIILLRGIVINNPETKLSALNIEKDKKTDTDYLFLSCSVFQQFKALGPPVPSQELKPDSAR